MMLQGAVVLVIPTGDLELALPNQKINMGKITYYVLQRTATTTTTTTSKEVEGNMKSKIQLVVSNQKAI